MSTFSTLGTPPLSPHSSHPYSSLHPPASSIGFSQPSISSGLRIRHTIYDTPQRGSTLIGLKDNILVRNDLQPSPSNPRYYEDGTEIFAYWIYKKLKKAIYGGVYLAYELRVKVPSEKGENGGYELTGNYVAIKKIEWGKVRSLSNRLIEDPLKEISCTQFLTTSGSPHILKALVALSDEKYLYSVLSYCNGGELFDHVEKSGRFSEPLARYWFKEILKGIQVLQTLGVCHRDMSLENMMVHNSSALIIDMGMCLRIPYLDSGGNIVSGVSSGAVRRCLLKAGRGCGKPNYMSPEIVAEKPFDGFSIDLWACGVMLFIMVTGVPPFDRAQPQDPRFQMSAINRQLSQMLTNWNMAPSDTCMDLLQRMLVANPAERLTLEEVCNHPWTRDSNVSVPRHGT
ncbi:hypothetical protein TrVE_jg11255 [Triparma verrucosa]|uniref:Protein kinase domain-containing protein n=1 Tax=Triparma verrucosa TaxID=1606542 RepID=A0A9W7KX21_9STRA|nr:hypothetical protein TrVE_jg11255 [Triparma verrucosa]